jgi:hypothetical protein
VPKGENTADHPGRQVHRERFALPSTQGLFNTLRPISRPVANFDDVPAHPAGEHEDYEPDYEAIMERRAERHRPDWA